MNKKNTKISIKKPENNIKKNITKRPTKRQIKSNK
jgi:hypothetical protein